MVCFVIEDTICFIKQRKIKYIHFITFMEVKLKNGVIKTI